MPAVRVGDIDMYYEVHGEGEPLVLICGLGSDITRWFRILPPLVREYKVIAFDNRGSGRSDKPDIPYTMEMMADDIAGLLDAIGIEAAHTFGVSMGGMIAQNYALRHPDKIISLMLGCTRCGGPHGIPVDSEARGALNPELIEYLSPEEMTLSMLPFMYSREFVDNSPDIIETLVEIARENPVDPAGYTRQMEAANGHDTYDRLPEIRIPTLVIVGDADRLIPVENSRILASRIPGAELAMLEGKGHGFYTEAPDDTCRILVDFMRRNGLSSG